MSTAVESAQLLLTLYDLRREPVLREARAWFIRDFNPATFEEFQLIAGGQHNAWYRMVLGYWDMACSFVSFGAIDAAMFVAANGEIVATFAKIEPFIAQLREARGRPDLYMHLESVVREVPGATARMERVRKDAQAAAAARAYAEGHA